MWKPSDLQVAVAAVGAAPASDRVAPGRAVKEVAVVVAAAVLLQDVLHLRLEERHVHVDRHHLQETTCSKKNMRQSNQNDKNLPDNHIKLSEV